MTLERTGGRGGRSKTTTTSSPLSAANRSSWSTRRAMAASRSRHQPSGRVPITFMPSTSQRTGAQANLVRMPEFRVNPAYTPVADQPKARDGLAAGILEGDRFQTLLGVTGSGKTATMAFTIEQVQRPALVIAHNKTLAAQLCNEFREFFPKNSVEYFVSYYDYYQPEAYVPAQDLYIEKDSSINEEIDRLRHSATSALFARRDVIVVASVSCIYGLGSPDKYNEQVQHFDPLTGEIYQEHEHAGIWPATHYATDRPTIERAIGEIRDELEARCKELEEQGKLLESHRLRQRTQFDMEMLRELGFCNGIENYSRILDGRRPGDRPFCLLDFFPDDFVCFIDESHQTVPQLGGMYEGDRSRKQTLVEYGFRLPSALDNRPQTPGEFERNHSTRIVEQIVRPTGIVDPAVDVRETRNQIDDLMEEVRRRVETEERTLVTTLTKKMAEDLTDYLLEYGFKVRYLHSEIDTLERIQIIRELRLGEFDVLVGINLLREGLDPPEVSLVAILYADKLTEAIRDAMDETERRRRVQLAYNEEHGITPESIVKGVSDIAEFLSLEQPTVPGRRRRGRAEVEGMDRSELEKLVIQLEEEMFAAAEELRFEYAAKLRDEIKELRRELVALAEAPA